MVRRGPLQAGEKVQLTDRKGKKITVQLMAGEETQTERGVIRHDDIIGGPEGAVVVTLTSEGSVESAAEAYRHNPRKPWKNTRKIGGWQYTVMRPRLQDFILSMPRGAQIMYPKDIAQVIEVCDIRRGMRVLESGGGSGAMGLHLLDAVGEDGELTTIEMRPEFARVCEANATVYFGERPAWWNLLVGDFDLKSQDLPEHYFDRIFLDMLDPWNRLENAWRVIAPGGVITCYVTTTTQLSRVAEAMRESGQWTEPEISETMERGWKAQGLAVRPNHEMIGHTGFLITARAMAPDVEALHKRQRATKDTYSDIDELTPEQQQARLEELELRDISDRKLRKVLKDLDTQVANIAKSTGRGENLPQ
ncbi:tRNA (adenine-N1)-methyltransferase [Bifidobacterium callimiconis]|uniref:tRNA (adenine-N1)-methyltransferase n=1 Tax=Bifidobacterium callimiconis TaxID=2306973 RepID=UPI001BDCF0D2|nr:tRNA (adenine-N1)-methyltransferase [Bifidobacterium callimiconis]MBT1176430.1 tRNA (adenine-N1)-methyltransferase [Bifidobacterium callimiconis]